MKIANVGLRGLPAQYSGIERAVEEISTRLARRDHEITVFCMANRYSERKPSFQTVRLAYIPTVNSKNLEMILYALPAAVASTFGKYDIVHFHALGPSTFSSIPRLYGAKTVVTVHGLDWQRAKWGKLAKAYLRLGEMSSVRFPNRTVVVSETLKRYYEDKYGTEVSYIPNGVTPRPKIPLGEAGERFNLREEEFVLFVGRLTREKNVHMLVDAFKQIDTKMKLVVVGGSSHTEDYVRDLQDLATSDNRILLTGPIYDQAVEQLFSNAYLFVLPSALEGLPVVLLEALSYGNAVLVSDIPENLEVIADRGTTGGFSFRSGDVQDLKTALEALLRDPDTVRTMRLQGRELVERKYDWDRITDETEDLYRTLVSQGGSRSKST